MPISKIEDAIKDIKKGKMVILVDDQDRENEGDLIITDMGLAFVGPHQYPSKK